MIGAGIQAIVFDKDGTLIDFEGSWASGMQALLQALTPNDLATRQTLADAAGYNQDTGRFLGGSIFVNGTTDDMMQAWQQAVPELDTDAVRLHGEAAFRDLDPVPLCDLPVVMQGFKSKGIKLGVVTNASEASTLVQLQKLRCLDVFDKVIGCDSGFTPKPAGDSILGFCDYVGLKPSQVAMVGDSTHDLNAGRAAGVGLNVGVLSGPASRDQIADLADVILNDITELANIFP